MAQRERNGAVEENDIEDAFEIWLDQLNGLLDENEHNIMVQKLVSVKIIPEVKALVEAEYKQFKTDSHKYVLNLFENWDKHSLFLIKTLECKKKHSEKVHSEIVKNEMEYLEIEHDLDSIIKNKDLPEALRNKLAEISMKEDLTFNDVSYYLDGVGIDTLMEFAKDIDEIIMADGDVTPAETDAKAEFEAYLVKRMEAEKNE